MPHEPRYVEPDSIQFVTFRTAASLLLLRPSPEINALILGVLARALALYPVKLFAYVFLSNHAHLLLRTPNADVLARFLSHVEGNIARGVQRLLGWRQRVWGARASYAAVIDDEAAIDRLRYILMHGAKERLVKSPLEWPGVTCARALVGLETPEGVWIDRVEEYEDRRRANPRGPDAYTKRYAIELHPLPCWAGLDRAEYQQRCQAMIDEIEATVAAGGVPPLGVEGVLAQDPRSEPRDTKKQPRPTVFASSPPLRRAYIARRRIFVDWYREASAARRAGVEMPFPPGSFESSRHYVPFPAVTRDEPLVRLTDAAREKAAPPGGVGVARAARRARNRT